MKCLLCLVSSTKKGSKDLDYLTNDKPLAEVLKKHFPFIAASRESRFIEESTK